MSEEAQKNPQESAAEAEAGIRAWKCTSPHGGHDPLYLQHLQKEADLVWAVLRGVLSRDLPKDVPDSTSESQK